MVSFSLPFLSANRSAKIKVNQPSALRSVFIHVAILLQSEQLVDLLLNTIMLSVPISGSHSHNFLSFSHGEYFYSLFQMTINTELLRQLDTTVSRLMKASSQNPSMVNQIYCR